MYGHIHDNFIVLPKWENWLLEPWLDFPLIILTVLTIPSPILLMLSARLGFDKYKFGVIGLARLCSRIHSL